jgi:hypothetical protein
MEKRKQKKQEIHVLYDIFKSHFKIFTKISSHFKLCKKHSDGYMINVIISRLRQGNHMVGLVVDNPLLSNTLKHMLTSNPNTLKRCDGSYH